MRASFLKNSKPENPGNLSWKARRNAWIKYSQFVCTIFIIPPRRISFLIWRHTRNREQYIDFRNPKFSFLPSVCNNTCLWNYICTRRAYVLGQTYIDSDPLWYNISLLVDLNTIQSYKANTSCYPQILIMGDIIMFLSIRHAFMVKSTELINYQRFGEWVCVIFLCINLADFYQAIIHMFS